MNIKELLPVGSVVLLKEGEKRLAIFGIKQTNVESGQEFDYLGVFYPEGYFGEDFQYLFNHEDIADVVFRGYEDPERTAFLERLDALYQKK